MNDVLAASDIMGAVAQSLETAGRDAARLIWDNARDLETVEDPRDPVFANAVIEELSDALSRTPGILQRVMNGAVSAAEDLNVEPFQGLVEVIQNADDLLAKEVRFAVRESEGRAQLLIVHDGAPVTCAHVLAMTLPFLTTKADDAAQKGRFGIGLKTLTRISSGLAVHSAPYHFKAERLSITRISTEPALVGFYDPATDTLLVLDLDEGFDLDALSNWFKAWPEDGLLFLNTVHSFRWCDVTGQTLVQKSVRATPWEPVVFALAASDITALRQRTIVGSSSHWTLYSADVRVPSRLARAHKATGQSTPVSIAVPAEQTIGGLYIAFKTRVLSSLQISIDAQFDPSTAREELIDNTWNRWLVARCADVIVAVASKLLQGDPRAAWKVIPIVAEHIGPAPDRWPCNEFAEAFLRVRNKLAASGTIAMGDALVPIAQTAYEDARLGDLLTTEDIEALAPGRKAVLPDARDSEGRWREVLNELNVSAVIGTSELLEAFTQFKFTSKPVAWWIDAAQKLTLLHPAAGIFGVPFLRAVDGRAIACAPNGQTARPLVFAPHVSRFSERWELLDRLHLAYGDSQAGEAVRAWLTKHAAYTTAPDAETELAAFAEKFAGAPIEISQMELRDLRDRFDYLRDRAASGLGLRVGATILLNGITYKGGKKKPCKVSPGAAYLPKTLDEHADWPEAASALPGIAWLSASYGEHLKNAGGTGVRRRDDGRISRGAKRFLMLLGAESTPRLVRQDAAYGERPTRGKQLRHVRAHRVEYDYASPDLERVLNAFERIPKRDRRACSAALMRTLSRHWERVYEPFKDVPAQEVKRVYVYPRGNIDADWLCLLKDTPWVAVGNGEIRTPANAVIRNAQTETLYENNSFVAGLEALGLSPDFAAAIGLITDVRASDLVSRLEDIKSGKQLSTGTIGINHIYRTLSKLCARQPTFLAMAGDLPILELRRRFSDGGGLVCVRDGEWKRPSDLFSGRDVFHKPELFVPSSSAYADLWQALEIGPPALNDCTRVCRELAQQDYSTNTEAALMDLYRYMESLLADSHRTVKKSLAQLPVACAEQWVSTRPVYLVEDREVRTQFSKVLQDVHFWTPPCDVKDLPELTLALGIERLSPRLDVVANRRVAQDQGEELHARFQAAVEHLSVGLARNDPQTREQLRITWDELRDILLFVYQKPFPVDAVEPRLASRPIRIFLNALLSDSPRELHVWEDAMQMRESGGRAIASLFPAIVQRSIQAEWVASWVDSMERPVEQMRFAADEEQKEKLLDAAHELAESMRSSPGGKIAVTPPASRTSSVKPRRLKELQADVSAVTVHVGTPVAASPPPTTMPLVSRPPAPSTGSSGTSRPAPVEYSAADLEQRGWEVLVRALETNDRPELQDFRNRRGVGADGAIEWTKFVELKAHGRSMPNSIQMTNAEYERALERGRDFILALVYGLEGGERTEACLIFDPARTLTVKPVNGVRLVGLSEATSVILSFNEDTGPMS
jgi:hypothetical protein